MAQQAGAAPHEAMEVHELLRTEITCLKKAQASINMVSDPDLKSFIEDSINTKKSALQDIDRMYSQIQGVLE